MTLTLDGTVGQGEFARDIALTIEKGEVLALVGPNGSGKSTIVASIAGLAPLLAGELTVAENVWDRPSTKTWVDVERRDCAVMFQDLRLFPHLDVEHNVAYGLRARRVSRNESRERVNVALEMVGGEHLSDRSPSDLSGGERQRVALARAIVMEPAVLLLDEPFASVDLATRASLRQMLPGLLLDLGAITLLVTHDPADVESVASGTFVL